MGWIAVVQAGRFAVWILALLALWAGPATAHREGESYVYIDVTEERISGEIHVRVTDFAKVMPLDSNGDGVADEAEFEVRLGEAQEHFGERLSFHAHGQRHVPSFDGLRFFSKNETLQAVLPFTLPTLGAPPDVIEVEHRFLFDGADPAHRPMLLQASSTKLGITDNEAIGSLVFAPGAERQELDLRPRPRPVIFADFVLDGVRQILGSIPHLCFAAALLLPVVLRRGDGRWAGAGTMRAAAIATSLAITVFALGFTLGTWLTTVEWVSLGWKRAGAAFVAAIALVALDNWRPLPLVSRALVVGVAGLLLGVSRTLFAGELGLERGFLATALTGFGVGVWLALAALALILVPMLALASARPRFATLGLRAGSVVVALIGGGLFALTVQAL